MPRKPKPLPANGSDRDVLASLLKHKAVWKLLLLWGTSRDGCSQEEIAQRVRELSTSKRYQITDEQLIQLYHLAIADALKPVTLQKKAA